MKKTLSIILLFWAFAAMAQSPKNLMSQGNMAYQKGDFEAAAKAYNAIIDAGYRNAEVFYNLGNAYYRQDEFGLAILNYERALNLKPGFRDAKENLDLANSKIEDEIDALPELFIVKWARGLTLWLSPTGWLILILGIAAILGAISAFFVLSNDYRLRKFSLIVGGLFALLLIIAGICGIAASTRQNNHRDAIVTKPLVEVKSSPENNSVDKLVLHEGTKVRREETLGEWHKIRIADGNTGWVTDEDITMVQL